MYQRVFLRISLNEKHFNKLEESVLRIERLRPQFVKIPEVDSLAELVVEESRDWDDVQNKFELLTQAWNSVSQSNLPSFKLSRNAQKANLVQFVST